MLKIIKKLFSIFIICLIITAGMNYYVVKNAENKTFASLEKIPYNKVGLLLGTSKYTVNGYDNIYYKNRIDAGIKLFNSGKIEYILVSGDNSVMEYNEPMQMKKDLSESGIPDEKIILDYAGFRTLDSIIRSREIFGQESITVISQKFHNERAIFLADNNNIKAIGYNAEDVTGEYSRKTVIREYFARIKMYYDLAVSVQPKFLGKKITIE